MNHHRYSKCLGSLAFAMCTMGVALIPVTALAERPEIDCTQLTDAQSSVFYNELTPAYVSKLEDNKFEEALPIVRKAMSICTTDVYTEYTLGRLYEKMGDCGSAYYHFENLTNRSKQVKQENEEIYDELKKNFKHVKEKCPDVVPVEILCETPDVMLSIAGHPVSNTECPYYTKMAPGAYSVIASREGFQTRTENITVSAEGSVITIPALKDNSAVGTLHVRCPKKATSFILVSSEGEARKCICPSFTEVVPAGSYKIYLDGEDESTAAVVVVEKQGDVDYQIPKTNASSCSAMPLENTSLPAGFALIALSLFGFAVMRRRGH